ncbi:hypothetical protein HPB50_010837 [Hyalomma asiaticum]|uniref:Uncharacterized protein n=1 Tax=Hyalomma asiaticum TaxID=266040 RepID=A0ACB7RQ92_HYAAI|nr:hypothetical protein HPB50_010837 [Hyalomma asiaticum]
MSSSRPSYFIVAKSYDYAVDDTELDLMNTIFRPSMFISISHMYYTSPELKVCRIFPLAMGSLPPGLKRGTDYSFGHTVNESLNVLQKIEKMGLNIPTAISFTFKAVYFRPNFTNPSSPRPEDFMLFNKCAYFEKPPFFDDPNTLCGNPEWTPVLPQLAYSIKQQNTVTYLTMSGIATLFKSRTKRDAVLHKAKKARLSNKDIGSDNTQKIYVNEHLCPTLKRLLGIAIGRKRDNGWKSVWSYNGKIFARKSDETPIACDAKQFHLDLNFGLVAYDVDADRARRAKSSVSTRNAKSTAGC